MKRIRRFLASGMVKEMNEESKNKQNVLLTGSRNTEHQLIQRTGLPGIIPSVVSWPTPPHTIVLILSHCLKTSVICKTSFMVCNIDR